MGITFNKLIELFKVLEEKKIIFSSVRDKIYIEDYQSSELVHYLDLFVHYDKKVRRVQAIRGILTAKENGIVNGRPRVSPEKIAQIRKMYHEYQYSYREISKKCRVSVGTVHKYLKEIPNEE